MASGGYLDERRRRPVDPMVRAQPWCWRPTSRRRGRSSRDGGAITVSADTTRSSGRRPSRNMRRDARGASLESGMRYRDCHERLQQCLSASAISRSPTTRLPTGLLRVPRSSRHPESPRATRGRPLLPEPTRSGQLGSFHPQRGALFYAHARPRQLTVPARGSATARKTEPSPRMAPAIKVADLRTEHGHLC
jgi:hypothetical protein